MSNMSVAERQSLQENLKSTYPPPKQQFLVLRLTFVTTCIFSGQGIWVYCLKNRTILSRWTYNILLSSLTTEYSPEMEKMLARIFSDRKQTWMLGNILIIEQLPKNEMPVSPNTTVWHPVDYITSKNAEQSRPIKWPHVVYLIYPNGSKAVKAGAFLTMLRNRMLALWIN